MKSRREIKAEALNILDHNLFGQPWLMFLVVELVFGVILGVLGYTVIAVLVLGGPIVFALTKMELMVVRREKETADFDTIGDGFKSNNFQRTLFLYLIENLFIFLWSLLLIIPGIVKYYAYSQAMYLAVDNEDYDWKKALDESQRLMKGHKLELFIQDLSFIGWYIVGSLVCGIGLLWVVPYFQASRAIYYNELVGGKKESQVVVEENQAEEDDVVFK